MSKPTIFGIPNCDTVKKARKWLESQGVDYEFHDFRKDGLSKSQVADWLKTIDAGKLVNKRSTTWKQLPEKQKENLDAKVIPSLLVEYPTLIKRPLLEIDGQAISVGFSEKDYQQLLK
ncbi:ArsC family reductase [Aurantivibrio plasticivorans]